MRARGSKHGGSKLTEKLVIEALQALDSGETAKSIGDRMGVHPSVILRIRDGLAWKHVARPGEHREVQRLTERGWAVARRVRHLQRSLARAEAELLAVRHQLHELRTKQEAA